jgi:alpha-1,2-mannosyltransferase
VSAAATGENVVVGELRSRTFYSLAAISVLLLSLAYQIRTPFAIDLGTAGDEAFLRGFHDAESTQGLSYRWSGDRSLVVFPGIGAYAPTLLRLRLNGHRPGDLLPPTVTLRANGRELASFPVTGEFETYELPIEREAMGASGTLLIELSSETFVPHEATGSGDWRELGLLVDHASVEFQGGLGSFVFPAPLPLLHLTGGVLASYLLARWFLSKRWALVTSLGILLVLAALLASKRMYMAPYFPWVLVAPALGVLVLELAHRTSRTKVDKRLYAAGLLAILLGLWRFGSVAQLSWMGVAPDFANNYAGAAVLRAGGMLYDAQAPLLTGYDNPPLTALLTMPLTFFDLQTAIRLFFGLNTLLLVASVALLFMSMRGYLLTYPYWLIAVALVVNLDPVLDSLLLGQTDAVILMLLVISFWAYRRGRDVMAGAPLGLAAMIKISPVLLILYFLLKKEKRVFASAVAVMLLLGGASLLLAGFEVHAMFVTEILPKLLAGSAHVENQSLNGFFNRLFLEGQFITGLADVPPLFQARLLTMVCSLLIVVGAAYLVGTKRASRTDPRADLEFSLVVIILPLISSIAWHHYMTWYVLPLLVLLNPRLRERLRRTVGKAVLVVGVLSYLILTVPVTAYAPIFLDGPARLLLSMRLFAGLSLFGICAYLLAKQRAGSAAGGSL